MQFGGPERLLVDSCDLRLVQIIAGVPVEQDNFGFSSSYQVEINPELPPTGGWQLPVFSFGDRGNETLTIRITPDEGRPWVASFALESRGFLNGVYACPGPAHLVVLTGAEALLVTASDPGAAEKLLIHPTVMVTRPPGTELLVIGSYTGALAVDKSGMRWVTDRLFRDDFGFVEGPPGSIRVRGTVDVGSKPTVMELDPATGQILGRAK